MIKGGFDVDNGSEVGKCGCTIFKDLVYESRYNLERTELVQQIL